MQISATMDIILQHISLQRFLVFFFFFKVTAIKFKNTHPAYVETLATQQVKLLSSSKPSPPQSTCWMQPTCYICSRLDCATLPALSAR